MTTVAVLGANGQLGSDVCAAFAARGWDVRPLLHAQLDLETAAAAAVEDALASLGGEAPAVIVNAAAWTNVPGAEAEPLRAFAVNAVAVRHVARACRALDALLVHVSTDYVFDGRQRSPYVETDPPAPLQVYGNSKLAGEHFARAECPRCAVVRSSGLYGAHPCRGKGGANFVETMLRKAREGEVAVVDDEITAPTYTWDLAQQLVRIADGAITGVVHAAAGGAVSWYDFAAAIFEITGQPVRLRRTRVADYPSPVRRPAYSVLASAQLERLGLGAMPHWRDGLTRYLHATAGPA
jgi:dTDP-4-dehydrorhamnose reductase